MSEVLHTVATAIYVFFYNFYFICALHAVHTLPTVVAETSLIMT